MPPFSRRDFLIAMVFAIFFFAIRFLDYLLF